MFSFFLVNGGFTAWTSFDECSTTCGLGKQERTRSCTNPEPKHGGKECHGPVIDFKECKVKPCPGKSLKLLNSSSEHS